MASLEWPKFRASGKVFVKVWDAKKNGQFRLPRHLTEKYDSCSEKDIPQILAHLDKLYAVHSEQEDAPILLPQDKMHLVKGFEDWLVTHIGNEPQTARPKVATLRNDVLYYFASETFGAPCPSFLDWPKKSLRLYEYFTHIKRVEHQSTASHGATVAKQFWAFLKFSGHLPPTTPELPVMAVRFVDRKTKTASEYIRLSDKDRAVYLRDINEDLDATPLPFVVNPGDVKKAAAGFIDEEDFEMAIVALSGYFGLLRPQEIFALMVTFIQTGVDNLKHDLVKSFEANKIIYQPTQQPLFYRCMFNVQIQRDEAGNIKNPKWDSVGQSFLWDDEAAKLFIRAINGLILRIEAEKKVAWNDSMLLFSKTNGHYSKRWSKGGVRGDGDEHTTVKDLRRAGIRELATKCNFSTQNIHLLQKLARHKDFGTTLLYMRDPKEAVSKIRAGGRLLSLDHETGRLPETPKVIVRKMLAL